MTKPLDKIVIVGGGSAGWITAAAIIKAYPNKDVTVIESPSIPTVGVGESTLGHFRHFCSFLEINEKDFMRHCDASYKMSIQFTDFYEKDAGSFHYPFGLPLVDDTIGGLDDWYVKKAMYPNTPIQDFVHCYFPAAYLFENDRYSDNLNGEFDNYNPKTDVAYHFDAIKFAIWLRDNFCKPRGVKHLQATVTDIKTNDDVGIEKLVLNTGDEVIANLFVDCTGFKSLLIGQAMKEEFHSYNHVLPNNRAWACQVPYKDKTSELQGFTNCTAIENGWVWNTPVWSRLGTGYVYSDKYVDPETAKEEFKRYLMSNKMLIPRTREEVDSLNFRDVPMRIGAYKNCFVKNVVAIGLSAGFIEPLESNGLLTVHEWALNLIRLLQRPAINEFDRNAFNWQVFNQWKSFADFVALHYSLSIRTDTDYWKSNFTRKVLSPGRADDAFEAIAENRMRLRKTRDLPNGMNWISVGMNWFFYDQISFMQDHKAYQFNTGKTDRLQQYNEQFKKFERRKAKWKKNAYYSPTLYQYQKENIYNEE